MHTTRITAFNILLRIVYTSIADWPVQLQCQATPFEYIDNLANHIALTNETAGPAISGIITIVARHKHAF